MLSFKRRETFLFITIHLIYMLQLICIIGLASAVNRRKSVIPHVRMHMRFVNATKRTPRCSNSWESEGWIQTGFPKENRSGWVSEDTWIPQCHIHISIYEGDTSSMAWKYRPTANFIWNHINRIQHIWNLSFTIQVHSDILLFSGIFGPVFVIFTCVHLYNFLNYESKAKSGMDECREKNNWLVCDFKF